MHNRWQLFLIRLALATPVSCKRSQNQRHPQPLRRLRLGTKPEQIHQQSHDGVDKGQAGDRLRLQLARGRVGGQRERPVPGAHADAGHRQRIAVGSGVALVQADGDAQRGEVEGAADGELVVGDLPVPGLGNGNLFIGFGIMLVGFLMTMGWR